MNQVTSSLCNMKIDELKRKEHLVSTNHLQLCRRDKDKIAINFLEMIFNAFPKKNKIFNLKSETKTHDFWQLYFSRKLSKEKFINYAAIQSLIQNKKVAYHQIFRISYRMLHPILEKHTLI